MGTRGTILIKDGNGRLVPEAYKISFSIVELISESRQIYDATAQGTDEAKAKIKSFINPEELERRRTEAELQEAANSARRDAQMNGANNF